jgi:hypothetical protein
MIPDVALVPAAAAESGHQGGLPPALFLAAAGVLAAVHFFAGRLTFLDRVPRSGWLSFGGGISVAYVFVHLLPEVEAGGKAVSDWLGLAFLEHHVYLVALAGFVVFYGLERLAKRAGSHRSSSDGDREREDDPSGGVFWVHIGSFTVYNLLVGYTPTTGATSRPSCCSPSRWRSTSSSTTTGSGSTTAAAITTGVGG